MSTTLMLMLGLVCFVAGMLGAALGSVLIWRMVRQRMQAQQGTLIGPLPAAVPAALTALTVRDKLPSAIDLALLADQVAARLQTQLNSMFDAQNLAQNLTQCAAQQKAELSLHQALQRVPPLLQQAIQVELEFLATQQVQRDQAQLQQQQRWQAEQAQRDLQRDAHHEAHYEAQRAAELRVLLQALSAHPAVAPEPAARLTAMPGTARVLPTPASLSARPPELLLTPLARAEPVYPSEVPTRELTDAEIDALPPELPAAGLPRKRIMPAPAKPVLKRL